MPPSLLLRPRFDVFQQLMMRRDKLVQRMHMPAWKLLVQLIISWGTPMDVIWAELDREYSGRPNYQEVKQHLAYDIIVEKITIKYNKGKITIDQMNFKLMCLMRDFRANLLKLGVL